MKAITFDAVGTLFRLAEPVGGTYSRIARVHGWEIPADLCSIAASAPPFKLPEAPFADLFHHFGEPKAWATYPEVQEVLENLLPHYPLVVISNFDRRFHRVSEGLGFGRYFQAVMLSGEVGCAKPAAFIFEQAARALDVAPDQILPVGDSPDADWAGGRAAGFQVFELVRPDLTLRDLPLMR